MSACFTTNRWPSASIMELPALEARFGVGRWCKAVHRKADDCAQTCALDRWGCCFSIPNVWIYFAQLFISGASFKIISNPCPPHWLYQKICVFLSSVQFHLISRKCFFCRARKLVFNFSCEVILNVCPRYNFALQPHNVFFFHCCEPSPSQVLFDIIDRTKNMSFQKIN